MEQSSPSLDSLIQGSSEGASQETASAAPQTGGEATGQQAVAAAPAYTPNYKFKFTDSAKDETHEREFDEFLRGVIKDADSEKKVRELYEKAYGLDYVKPKLAQTREQYKAVQQEYQELQEGIRELSGFVQRGDLDSFFSALKLPQEKIFQFVLDKLNYQGLSPDQKRAYDESRDLQSRAYLQEKRLAEMESALQQQAVQARTLELESALGNSEVRSIAEQYDARVGKPGAFREEVIRRGQMAFYTTGTDIPVGQAIQETLNTVGRLVTPGMTQQGQFQGQHSAGLTGAQQGNPPVIPNMGGGKNVSAVAKQVRSLSDVESIYQEKFGR